MKLVVLLSIAALVACDYSAPVPETPSDAYAPPDKVESVEESSASIEPANSFFKFNNVYRGAFPPSRFPSPSFHSFGYPFKAVNLAAQGILPPISQVLPPQLSQIVPPISQIVPPVFGNAKPVLPVPAPVFPPQVFPPAPVTNPLLNKFTFPYHSFTTPYSYQYPYSFPSAFPSTFSFPPAPLFPAQKQPSKTQTESLSTSYGPPVSGPADPEPAGAVESSAPFDPSPVSYPYEPATPEAAEPAVPHKPAQEYGPPAHK